MEKEPTWQQLWDANTRLSTRLAEVERERDAEASINARWQEMNRNQVEQIRTITTERDAAIRERDELKEEAKWLKEKRSVGFDNIDALTSQVKVLREALAKKYEVTPHAHGSGKWRLYGHRPEYVCVFKNEQEARRVCELLNQELESRATLTSEGAEG